MKLLFTPEALESYQKIKLASQQEADKVKEILKEILLHPEEGQGNPVPLTGALSGLWSREYGIQQQIVYSANKGEVKIYAVGQSIIPANQIGSVGLSQTQYSEQEYRSVLNQMAANRGKGEDPKVGIFWYNVGRDELFGVVSHPLNDYSRANASDGRITCSELHEDVWKKEFHKQRYKGDNSGPFIGAYQDKPRGRIFYNIETDTFEVAAGKWLQEYPHVYDMILREFNLPPERTSAKYAVHWDIGQSWQ